MVNHHVFVYKMRIKIKKTNVFVIIYIFMILKLNHVFVIKPNQILSFMMLIQVIASTAPKNVHVISLAVIPVQKTFKELSPPILREYLLVIVLVKIILISKIIVIVNIHLFGIQLQKNVNVNFLIIYMEQIVFVCLYFTKHNSFSIL